jgi:hypothetical protein
MRHERAAPQVTEAGVCRQEVAYLKDRYSAGLGGGTRCDCFNCGQG